MKMLKRKMLSLNEKKTRHSPTDDDDDNDDDVGGFATGTTVNKTIRDDEKAFGLDTDDSIARSTNAVAAAASTATAAVVDAIIVGVDPLLMDGQGNTTAVGISVVLPCASPSANNNNNNKNNNNN
jgi:hypothetical protein